MKLAPYKKPEGFAPPEIITVDLYTSSGWKYQVERTVKWQLLNNFTILRAHETRYYKVSMSGLLTIKASCCYNGADCFPDTEWMRLPSLIHDVLLWLIAAGAIPESENDLVDRELADLVKFQEPKTFREKYLRRIRAIYIFRATNLAQTRIGEIREIKHRKIKILIPSPH